MRKILIAAMLASGPALAQAAGSEIDLYYMSSGIEVDVDGFGSGDDDGDGFGVKGQFALSGPLFLTGEYQSASYDDSNLDANQLRGGIGYMFTNPKAPIAWFGQAELINLEFDDGSSDESDTGFGIHAGGLFKAADTITLTGRLGYVDVDGSSGLEFLIGASMQFTPKVGGFVDYRMSDFDDDDVTTTLDDLRLGVRLLF